MPEDFDKQIEEIMSRVYETSDKPTQARLIDDAIRLADAAGNEELGFELRTEIFEPATFGGLLDLLLVHFAWCIARTDRDPEKFPVERLMWVYKWVLDDAPAFPNISAERLTGLLTDFERRLNDLGASQRTAVYLRAKVYRMLGRGAEADALTAVWEDLPRDHWSDCEACEPQAKVSLYAALGRDEDCLKAADHILKNRMTCSSVPTSTHATTQIPALRLGQFERVQAGLLRGYAQAAAKHQLSSTGRHIQALALTHNNEWAEEAVRRHLNWGLTNTAVGDQRMFLLGAELTFARLAPDTPCRLDFPAGVTMPAADESVGYTAAMLHAYFARRVDEIDQQFDRRNGNDVTSRESAELRGMLATVPEVKMKRASGRK